MNLGKVMDEIATALQTISGLRVYAYPTEKPAVPAAIVTYGEIDPDKTYRRGMDRYTIPVVVVVGKISDRASRDAITKYVTGAGATSVKAAIDGFAYTTADAVTTGRVSFDRFTMNQVDYLAATFEVDVVGSGTTT